MQTMQEFEGILVGEFELLKQWKGQASMQSVVCDVWSLFLGKSAAPLPDSKFLGPLCDVFIQAGLAEGASKPESLGYKRKFQK